MADAAESTPVLTRDHRLLLALAKMPAEHGPLLPHAALLLMWGDKLSAGTGSFLYPGTTPVADFHGVSRGTIQNARKQLVNAGLITVTGKGRETQVWTIHLPEPSPMDVIKYQELLGRSGVKVTKPIIAPPPPDKPDEPVVVVTTVPTRKERKRRVLAEGEETTKKSRTMSDEDKVLACSSLAMMERWLLWGTPGLHEADDTKLTPTQMNWRAVNPEASTAELKVKEWTPQHFAAYFWWQISKYRESHKLPITMPDVGRICKAIVTLRSKMTAWQLAQRIANVCGHFDLIRFELDWANIALDESALQDQNITKKIVDIENSGEFVLQGRYAKLQAAVAEQGQVNG